MSLLSFSVKDNVFECTRMLLEELHIQISGSALYDRLVQHPDYPSLYSVSETLTSIGISNIGVKTNIEDISSCPLPFLVPLRQAKGTGSDFTVVKAIKAGKVGLPNIVFLDAKTLKWKVESVDEFNTRWMGSTVLLVDASECNYTEKSYVDNKKREKTENIAQYLPFVIMALAALLICVELFLRKGFGSFSYIGHICLTLLGILATYAIVMHEMGQDLSGVQQLCGAGKKINCAAILNSSASKIIGIGWGEIGFTYFLGNLLFILFSGVYNLSTFFLLAWINVLSLPYTFFSIYYQWRVVKQWCPLCLTVQGVVIGQFLLAWLDGWQSFSANTASQVVRSVLWLGLGLAYLVPISLLTIAIPFYRNYLDYKQGKDQLGRILRTPSILNNILASESLIKGSADDLGIVLGLGTAKHTITKVCNPYCGPCAKTHKVLEEILSGNDNMSLRIVFTATDSQEDYRLKPVRHFMALAETLNGDALSKALDDWYGSPQKDYTSFADKYPIAEDLLNRQDEKIRHMDDWCRHNNIKVTPTLYLDGHLLPENISLKQIRYI